VILSSVSIPRTFSPILNSFYAVSLQKDGFLPSGRMGGMQEWPPVAMGLGVAAETSGYGMVVALSYHSQPSRFNAATTRPYAKLGTLLTPRLQ
jgi:hypothetical protein